VCVEDVVARPAFRGRGIAPATYSELADRLEGNGFDRLICKVPVENFSSRRAFEKAGFRKVAFMHHRRRGPRVSVTVEPIADGVGPYLAERLAR
jgi:RimJ/RimL family protein N-acetyltransferase